MLPLSPKTLHQPLHPETIRGDDRQILYDDFLALGNTVAPRFADEASALFFAGVLPKGALALDHYHWAVLRHREGRISDPELVALALLLSLGHESQTKRVADLLQKFPNSEDSRTKGAADRSSELPPFLEILNRHRIRRIKEMARQALIGWALGTHPGHLVMGRTSNWELLGLQALGLRPVGAGLPLGEFLSLDRHYPGGFTHHDLCHLAQFRGPVHDSSVYAGQVGFFDRFSHLVRRRPEALQLPRTGQEKTPEGYDLALVAADTNGDVRLLLTLYIERRSGIFKYFGELPPKTETLLEDLGMPGPVAAALAPRYAESRRDFLAEAAPYFVKIGEGILAKSLETHALRLTTATLLTNMHPLCAQALVLP